MKDFGKLSVWERSHHLTLAIYTATEALPGHELNGSQHEPLARETVEVKRMLAALIRKLRANRSVAES